MKKYTLIFGTDLINRNKLDSPDTYNYYDNGNTKTLGDIKDFITCFNNSLCTCMLKLYIDNNHRYNGIEDDKSKLEEISKNGKIYIGQIEQKCKCGFLRLNKDLISLSKRNVIEKINDLEKKEESGIIQERDFYDAIIKINSIRDINTGLKINMSEKGEINYKKYKDIELFKIGVIGGINKGKSFILSKLSKMKFPTGTSLNTKGLSIKYCDLENGNANRKFILLDSPGFEKPILRREIKQKEIKEEKKEENDDYLYFKSRLRDNLITESFLRSFIISESDLLLIIIDALSLSEQKLLNKIKREIKIRKEKKKIFVIHNLKTYRSIAQVEEYINETLLKSTSFQLEKDFLFSTDKKIDKLGYHFIETNVKDLNIYHLIFAADGSDAGNFFNKYTLDFIEEQYDNISKKESFDIIKEIKSKISEYSKRYFDQKIELDEFRADEDDLEEKLIKLKKKKELSLNECIIDEIGLQTFKINGYEPQYNYFINHKENILEIRVELPGNIDYKIQPVKYIEDDTVIIIEGEKKKDDDPKNIEDNIFNSRDFGKFFVEIQFKTETHKIKTKLKSSEIKRGILILQHDLLNEEREEKLK